MKHLVAPSLLAADFCNLEKEIRMVNESQADWIHCDIMDGVFVPNISFGFPVLEKVRKIAAKPLDVHLMITDPDRYLSRFRDHGAAMLTVQYEACIHLHRTVSEIHNLGMKAGVAINPHTPVSLLENILPFTDMILIMSVNPGFGGQKFIEESYKKISALRVLIEAGGYPVMIEVDGGVDTGNAGKLTGSGADVLVAGNSVFGANDPVEAIRLLKNLY
jgi:ribulose-phosphate 3-epimerase